MFNSFVSDVNQDILTSGLDAAKIYLSYITDMEFLFQYYHCPIFGNYFDDLFKHMLPLVAACGNIHY